MAADEPLLSQTQDGVLTLTLNRPDASNALNARLLGALSKAIRDAERDEHVKVLVLTGGGAAFCAGQDLQELEEVAPTGQDAHFGRWLRIHYNPLITRIRGIEKPVIGAVNGVAVGAGMSLALACDLRIASPQASFVQASVNAGLVPDSGSLYLLPRMVGLGKAIELSLLGDRIDAQEALTLGLVGRVVPAEDLQTMTHDLAVRMAGGATKAMALIKRGLNRSLEAGFEQMLDYEAYLQEVAGRTSDFKEGVMAFSEKRPAHYTGQ